MARKTIRLATKVKDPKTFEQKYKTIDGKTFTYTPDTAWAQTFGKQPRLLRNSGAAFLPSPSIYGPCRPSRLSDYVAYKFARRSGPCLRFLDIENPTAPHHPVFGEDKITGSPVKLFRQEKMTSRSHPNNPTKKGQSDGKTNKRAPNPQNTDNTRNEFAN